MLGSTWWMLPPGARLEETYLAVVRDWGQSIESADSYTFGHCERVAIYALASPKRWDWTRPTRRPSGSAPTSTTSARSGCRTRS